MVAWTLTLLASATVARAPEFSQTPALFVAPQKIALRRLTLIEILLQDQFPVSFGFTAPEQDEQD